MTTERYYIKFVLMKHLMLSNDDVEKMSALELNRLYKELMAA